MTEQPHRDEPGDPSTRELEALLAELEADDLEPVEPPPAVWAAIEAATSPVAAVRELRPRRPIVTWLAAAAVLAVAVVGTTALLRSDDDVAPVVSAGTLAFDPVAFDPRGADAHAHAELVDRRGRYELRLTDVSLPEVDGDDLELWLIEPDAAGNPVDVAPVALLHSDGSQVYDVPSGLDPTTHFVVDISIEPRDGDSAHSGQSILRGPLTNV